MQQVIQSPPVRQTIRLDAIQGLRAVAATLVLLSHVCKEMKTYFHADAPFFHIFSSLGQYGVDIFFVISGIIMVYTNDRTEPTIASSRKFLVRRFLRIAPIYWFLTIITIAISIFSGEVKNHSDLDLNYIISSFLFIPSLRSDGHVTPVLGVGWTLNYEMFFYIVFAITLLFRRSIYIYVSTAVFVALVALGSLVQPQNLILWYWSRPIILEFAAGAIIAKIYLSGVRLSPFLAYAAVVVGVAYWAASYLVGFGDMTDSEIRFWFWGVSAILVVGGVALARVQITELLNRKIVDLFILVGDSSFALYLSHMFFVRVVTLMALRLFGPNVGLAYLILIVEMLVAIIGSIPVFRYIEKPMHYSLQRLFRL